MIILCSIKRISNAFESTTNELEKIPSLGRPLICDRCFRLFTRVNHFVLSFTILSVPPCFFGLGF